MCSNFLSELNKRTIKNRGTEFSLAASVPTVGEISSFVTYSIVEWWRPPGDGHNAAIGEDENGRRSPVKDAAIHVALPEADGHSMARASWNRMHGGHSKQANLRSHACHLLS